MNARKTPHRWVVFLAQQARQGLSGVDPPRKTPGNQHKEATLERRGKTSHDCILFSSSVGRRRTCSTKKAIPKPSGQSRAAREI